MRFLFLDYRELEEEVSKEMAPDNVEEGIDT